jgi:hypothetical protein
MVGVAAIGCFSKGDHDVIPAFPGALARPLRGCSGREAIDVPTFKYRCFHDLKIQPARNRLKMIGFSSI